jgi:hypothetical protein
MKKVLIILFLSYAIFGGGLLDEGLPESLTALFTECVGDENHTLTAKEKEKLHKHFKGLAWVLIQKG